MPLNTSPTPALQRSTGCGEVVGCVGPQQEYAWLGIPYAAPPIGALRWRAPQPPARWADIYCAQTLPSPSLQRNYFPASKQDTTDYLGSEDCLYLNIWAPPATTIESALPVMVWIHGGGNAGGQGASYYGGLLATQQNVIVVTVNYRLGVFGWFRHAALRSQHPDRSDQSGNFGLLDLIAALRWVRENIAAFGGDAGNVTVFGESAGGSNIFGLLVAPRAEGLFQRAIVQSGSPTTTTLSAAEHCQDEDDAGDPQSAGEVLLQLLINDRQAIDRNAAKAYAAALSDTYIAAYLHNKSFADFDRAYQAILQRAQGPSPLGFPHLFCDGYVLPTAGIVGALEAGAYHRIPILLGCTRDEFSLLLPLIRNSPLPALRRGESNGENIYLLAADYLSRLFKAYAVDRPAAAIARYQPGQVFAYRFDWDELAPAAWLGNVSPGAAHGLDVPFVFGHLQLGPEFFQLGLIQPHSLDSYRALSAAMMAYWTQFARSGDPARGSAQTLPLWSAWQPESQDEKFMVLDSAERLGLRMVCTESSKEQILAALRDDAHFATDADRHQFLQQLIAVGGFAGMTSADSDMLDNNASAHHS